MNYSLNLGMWGSVFAVPSEIVDKHLRLAGAAQLKVLLWILRHNSENFTDENIGQALSMQAADVRDAMQYWVQVGVIVINNNVITPPPQIQTVPQPPQPEEIEKVQTEENKTAVPSENETKQLSRLPVSSPKPDMQYLARRMNEDENVAYLMQAADNILGRMTSNNDKCILLNIHEYDGLPVEVIIMLLQYASDIGKTNLRYIDKIAITWADEEINTLDRAEKKIKQLTEEREAAYRIQKIFGIDSHSPTERENYYANCWFKEWQFSEEMVREAYETCVDQKGKYIPKYTHKILEHWHQLGIKTVEQITDEENKHRKKAKAEKTYGGAYDLEAYENTDPFAEEE
ncbi:MAG: DnaD domain protein [Acutalibacteraceae bacterium]